MHFHIVFNHFVHFFGKVASLGCAHILSQQLQEPELPLALRYHLEYQEVDVDS